nr:MAG TPA: hypothetical protein [Caudoviricetes sp.]
MLFFKYFFKILNNKKIGAGQNPTPLLYKFFNLLHVFF